MSAPLYRSEDLRRIEALGAGAQPPLMERAGLAAAGLAARLAADTGGEVLVLAGPGNNGGDARVAAARLAERGFRTTIARTLAEVPRRPWALVIDGLFGIGLTRALEGEAAKLVQWVNACRCPVLALDVPSGLDADTGRVLGCAVRATHTLTFLSLKPGLLTLDGPDHCGELTVDALGLDLPALVAPQGRLAGRECFPGLPRRRPRNFHKGLAGSVGILGGAPGMAGAAFLAGRAALRIGAGRVYAGLLDGSAPSVDLSVPELMVRAADEALGLDLDALVAGPGLGQGERAETLLGAVLAAELPCVLDADALNLLADSGDLKETCLRRGAPTLLTPHPAEAGRLLGAPTAKVQEDRVSAARRLAAEYGARVVLKGNGSILAARDGRWYVNATGNPGMASAGMGDVLAGLLGGLLAQGVEAEAALVLGVHLHGAVADRCAAAGQGPIGLAASEVADAARALWNEWSV